MRSLTDLPLEMIAHILAYAIPGHSHPLHILTVHSSFLLVALPILHANIHLSSFSALQLFAHKSNGVHLSRVPNTLQISLPGGHANKHLWTLLRKVFLRCRPQHLDHHFDLSSPSSSSDEDDESASSHSEDETQHLAYYHPLQHIKHVRLSLNSLASDPSVQVLSKTLGVLNPTSFSWTGPDPDHNFSCAIVPAATDQLFRGLTSWTHLTQLHLSAISFSRCRGRSLLSLTPDRHPLLRRITIQRAVFILPIFVASCAIQCSSITDGGGQLEELLLVDAYQESIWGPRVRKVDVEEAVMMMISGGGGGSGGYDVGEVGEVMDRKGALERVRTLVRCEARTERLEGGDREVSVCS